MASSTPFTLPTSGGPCTSGYSVRVDAHLHQDVRCHQAAHARGTSRRRLSPQRARLGRMAGTPARRRSAAMARRSASPVVVCIRYAATTVAWLARSRRRSRRSALPAERPDLRSRRNAAGQRALAAAAAGAGAAGLAAAARAATDDCIELGRVDALEAIRCRVVVLHGDVSLNPYVSNAHACRPGIRSSVCVAGIHVHENMGTGKASRARPRLA